MAQTWISVFLVAIPPPTLPLLWPSALRIWVSLAKSMPMPPWPHHPSRRKTKSPHITNKNTNNLEKSPIQPTFNFIIPLLQILYVYRSPLDISKLNKNNGDANSSSWEKHHLRFEPFQFWWLLPDLIKTYPILPTPWTLILSVLSNLIYTLLFLCPFLLSFIWDLIWLNLQLGLLLNGSL